MSYLTTSKKIGSFLTGLFFLLFLSPITLVAVMLMNKEIIKPKKEKVERVITMTVKPPKPPKKKKQQKKKRKPKKQSKQSRPVTPPPNLGVSFSGVDFGLPEFNFNQNAGMSDALIDDVDDMVMTEDTVDEKPVLRVGTPPQYPARARNNNIEGRVVLNILVGSDGSPKMVKVVEATPSGVFDSAALSSARGYKFKPAMYKDRPVEVWVMLPLEFNLN